MVDPNGDLESSLRSADLAGIEDVDVDTAFDIVENVGPIVGAEIIPEIPILKTLYALFRATRSVSNYLLMKKIVLFLTELRSIDAEERETFLARLDGPDRERIVDDLLLVLDRHDAHRKSEIQGKLFVALIRDQLDNREYLALTHATSTINIDSIDELKRFYADELPVDDANMQMIYSFAFVRLVGIDNSSVGAYGGGMPKTQKVPLGEKFVTLLIA